MPEFECKMSFSGSCYFNTSSLLKALFCKDTELLKSRAHCMREGYLWETWEFYRFDIPLVNLYFLFCQDVSKHLPRSFTTCSSLSCLWLKEQQCFPKFWARLHLQKAINRNLNYLITNRDKGEWKKIDMTNTIEKLIHILGFLVQQFLFSSINLKFYCENLKINFVISLMFQQSLSTILLREKEHPCVRIPWPKQLKGRKLCFGSWMENTLCHGKLHYEGRCMSDHCVQSWDRSNEFFHSVLFLIIIQLRTQPIKCCYPHLRWL